MEPPAARPNEASCSPTCAETRLLLQAPASSLPARSTTVASLCCSPTCWRHRPPQSHPEDTLFSRDAQVAAGSLNPVASALALSTPLTAAPSRTKLLLLLLLRPQRQQQVRLHRVSAGIGARIPQTREWCAWWAFRLERSPASWLLLQPQRESFARRALRAAELEEESSRSELFAQAASPQRAARFCLLQTTRPRSSAADSNSTS
mmetsp:Transcript_12010/g.26217  ORF Transcript_12010/g.26217 Transcript_12010/m.26217 type:complete len:205 (-) Transcript_12010:482-1096(-)